MQGEKSIVIEGLSHSSCIAVGNKGIGNAEFKLAFLELFWAGTVYE